MAGNKNSFKMGTVEMLVLYLLNQRDLYGYEISTLLRSLSEEKYVLADGSLYPILYRMEDKQYISSRDVVVGRRRTRVYYHIEMKGRKKLSDLLSDYRTIADGIQLILAASIKDAENAEEDRPRGKYAKG